MIKISNKDECIEMSLPLKIEYKGRVFWVKESTKEGKSIYMNDQPPFREIEIKESDSVNISVKI